MSRYQFTLSSRNREMLSQKMLELPAGWRVTVQETKRSIPQNDRFHAMLTDIAVQLVWIDGRRHPMEHWKRYFMHALRGELWMPHEDGGMVPIGYSSADLGRSEMSAMMELLAAFGARHGIEFHEEENEKEDSA